MKNKELFSGNSSDLSAMIKCEGFELLNADVIEIMLEDYSLKTLNSPLYGEEFEGRDLLGHAVYSINGELSKAVDNSLIQKRLLSIINKARCEKEVGVPELNMKVLRSLPTRILAIKLENKFSLYGFAVATDNKQLKQDLCHLSVVRGGNRDEESKFFCNLITHCDKHEIEAVEELLTEDITSCEKIRRIASGLNGAPRLLKFTSSSLAATTFRQAVSKRAAMVHSKSITPISAQNKEIMKFSSSHSSSSLADRMINGERAPCFTTLHKQLSCSG